MRRKLFIVLLAFVLAIAFASCGNSSTGSIEGETDDTEEEINVPISWIVEPTNEYYIGAGHRPAQLYKKK